MNEENTVIFWEKLSFWQFTIIQYFLNSFRFIIIIYFYYLRLNKTPE